MGECRQPVTADQYRAAIAQLGLSQEGAGGALGLSPRQGQRYATGESEIPEPVAKLLRLMIRRLASCLCISCRTSALQIDADNSRCRLVTRQPDVAEKERLRPARKHSDIGVPV